MHALTETTKTAIVDLSFAEDPLFHFDEERHLYSYDGRPLDSVSRVRKELSVPFDAERIARFVARRRGVAPAVVLAEWEEKRSRASARGEVVHECVEKYLETGCMPAVPTDRLPPDDLWDVLRRLQEFQKWYERDMSDVQVVATELRMYSLTLGIAGTLDSLVLRGDALYVLDWKTNGKFRTDGDKSYNNLLGPFMHLPDNEHNSYSIQVAAYRIMLHEHGVRTAGGLIAHLPEDGPPRLYPALDLRAPLWDYLKG